MPLRHITHLLLAGVLLGGVTVAARADTPRSEGVDDPAHAYFTSQPNDRFQRLHDALVSGQQTLDTSGELALLRSLLAALEIPESSQTLVFSVTSLQKALISPRRPRALYFNDDTYVGYVPGGRLEVISSDPKLGCNFYIFDRLSTGTVPRAIRSEECMNCHAPRYLDKIPGLVIESVVPGLTGGGERAFRRQQSGHGIPFAERFGGWHVTGGGEGWPKLLSDTYIERKNGEALELPLPFGRLSDPQRYLRPTSELLPHLLQEHQVGFVNRVLRATYRVRELQKASEKELAAYLSQAVDEILRYLLFADEVPLPGPLLADPDFTDAFSKNRKASSVGAALKDLELGTRLFRYRCSYMIYTPAFDGMPSVLKNAVLTQLRRVLSESPGADATYSYLPEAERRAILQILHETLPAFRDLNT